ncbi:MAG: RT0821/Lpp0805 family surface protein [Bauldia sp.]
MPRLWRPTAVSGHGMADRAPRFLILGIALSLLTGCAGMGLPFAEFGRDRTGSTVVAAANRATAAAVESVDPSDWETVRRAVAEAIAARNHSAAINWSNPDTGSSGTIAPLLAVTAGNGACRPFSTTMSDARGIRHFRGEACRETTGRIQLLRVTADDPALI